MQPELGLPGSRFAPAELVRRLREARPGQPLDLVGITAGALPLLAAILPRALGRPLLLIVPTPGEAESIAQDAGYYAHALGAPPPLVLPPLEPEPYLGVSPHLQTVVDRAIALHRAGTGALEALIAPAEALLLRVTTPAQIAALARRVSIADAVDRDTLVRDLVRAGYRRQDMVGSVGEIAVRGGILDVFSPAHPTPLRLELDVDTVASIRAFDPVSQRSESEVLEAILLPLTPFPLDERADERLRTWGATLDETLRDDLRSRREALKTRGSFPGIEYYLPAFTAEHATVLDHLPGFAVAVVEPESAMAAIEKALAGLEEAHSASRARGHAFPAPAELALTPAEARTLVDHTSIRLQAIGGTAPAVHPLHTQPARRYEGRIKELVTDLAQDREQGLDAVVVLPTAGEAERVEAMLSEYGIAYREGERAAELWRHDATPPLPGRARVAVAIGRLTQGFRSPDLKLAVYAAPEVFGGAMPAVRRRKGRAAAFASDFRDLKVGDHVVHIDHGIARFEGLKTVTVGPSTQEFMVLAYASEGRLYVPLDRLDLVQKYQGMEGFAPRLDTLGGPAWARVKRKVKAELVSMATELLQLYASRRVMKGHAFSPDGLFQKEFEDAFPFTATPDQLTAVDEIKRDMESSRCMDRLLCGDVGYGKTEVAMRAAFKAVGDGKQVALLCPTTVLAFQHERTFRERFGVFPVRVEMVSRFKSKKEIDTVLKDVAKGTVDVLIGTHRLLSRDIAFRDLGLLVIDEEQRFGVAHKEKLKQIRRGIDVLTMTATPIPRTLQMSLAGLRDMAVIETPPKDRLAIDTAVLRFESQVIREGVKREMERGGQVYFVHNRVESIWAMSDTLHKIVPFARLAVAHGQMKEGELEEAMMGFVERRADILISTTIIENGLDLPNVNTIFINRAHRLGLAQLYQLRGRVGRSDRPAYAYLLVPANAELTPVARRRLHAIQEFTELGSGFRIAALDLQIRGAGSVLGREQHGHIASIGFDLYMDLLEQTVRELKGEEVEETTTQLSLGLDVHVPEDYIADVNQRLMVYKKVAGARAVAEVDDIGREIADRFGPLPAEVENLLEAARLKIEAQARRIQAVEREGTVARLRFGADVRIEPQALVAFAGGGKGRKLHPDGRLEFPVPRGREALAEIRSALAALG